MAPAPSATTWNSLAGNFVDPSIEVAPTGPVVGLFGRSGSGKTSLVNALAGISRPERGRVVVNGATLFDSERGIDLAPERRRLGYVFQDDLLFPHLHVEANLLYGFGRAPRGERVIEPRHVIELLGLDGLLRRFPEALSGGRPATSRPRARRCAGTVSTISAVTSSCSRRPTCSCSRPSS